MNVSRLVEYRKNSVSNPTTATQKWYSTCMTIQEVYTQFRLPRNLQRHQYRVAALGAHVADHSAGEVDRDAVITTLLMHDLGNILKFDWDQAEHLFDEDERDIAYWQRVQADIREQFGAEVHSATIAMAQEVGASPTVVALLQQMGTSQLLAAVEGDNWELKICLYSDARVDPFGYKTVQARFADILERYKDRFSPEKVKKMKQSEQGCLLLEQQLNDHFGLALPTLPEQALKDMESELSQFSHFS